MWAAVVVMALEGEQAEYCCDSVEQVWQHGKMVNKSGSGAVESIVVVGLHGQWC